MASDVVKTAIHSRVLFNDGEGVEQVDFNDLQYVRWAENFAALQAMLGSVENIDLNGFQAMGTDKVFCPRAGAGYIENNFSGLQLDFIRGAMLLKNPDSTSEFPIDEAENPMTLVMLDTDLAFITLDTADGSNPRIDLIEVKITDAEVSDSSASRDKEDAVTRALTTITPDKRRRAEVTFRVKNGTPAADPSPPTVDAGWAELANVFVGTGATSLTFDTVWDLRFPMQVEFQRIFPTMLGYWGSLLDWSNDAVGNAVALTKLTATDTPAFAFPHTGDQNARILGFMINAEIATLDGNEAVNIVRYDDNSGTAVLLSLRDLITDMSIAADTGSMFHSSIIERANAGGIGVGKHRPVWANFYGPQERRKDRATYPAAHGTFFRVGTEVRMAGLSSIYECGFIVAKDL